MARRPKRSGNRVLAQISLDLQSNGAIFLLERSSESSADRTRQQTPRFYSHKGRRRADGSAVGSALTPEPPASSLCACKISNHAVV